MKYIRIKTFLALLFFTIILLAGCTETTSPPGDNTPPETLITNVPAENDTLFPLINFSWNGGDNDGYVAKYEYRYITYLSVGDSIVQEWTQTPETNITITLISGEKYNRQKFQVRAIDNNGTPDPSPAEKNFYTYATIAPVTEILYPASEEDYFILENVTDWWKGINFIFKATDQDGEVVGYKWSVDNGEWHSTTDTSVIITPALFSQPLEGEHSFKVYAIDNTDLPDENIAEVRIKLVKPSFTKKILIIDETNESNWPSGMTFTDSDVDNFYADILGLSDRSQWDEWDYKTKGGPPDKEELGKYKIVLWHGDDRPTNKPHELANNQALIEEYANAGGNIILSGWRMIKSFAWQSNFPVTFPADSFANEYLHVTEANETPLGADFTHGVGVGQFNSVIVDTTKLKGVFPFYGSLSQVNVIPGRGSFTDIILTYGTSDNSKYASYRGLPCGLIYYGTSFNAVILGFPLFFIEKEDAKVLATRIMNILNTK